MAEIIHTRVSKNTVDRLQPGQMIRDTQLPGFGARRQKTATTYFLQKRVDGRLRWLTIGTHGAPWTPETARKEALKLLGAIAGGVDPAAEKREVQAKILVRDAAALFLEQHGPKLKPDTRESYGRMFHLHIVPAFGERRLRDLARADVSRLHAQLLETPSTANYVIACLSKFLGWAGGDGGSGPRGQTPAAKSGSTGKTSVSGI